MTNQTTPDPAPDQATDRTAAPETPDSTAAAQRAERTSGQVPDPKAGPAPGTESDERSGAPAATGGLPTGEEPDGPPVGPDADQPSAPPDRRVLRGVLRWTAVVAVFAAVGVSTAYGITRMERTDVPGLATASDGRWDYPTLTKPPLPSGSPGPFAESNTAGAHHADLRALVLPAPAGAKEDAALRGADGWLKTKVFLEEYAEKEDREEFRDTLDSHALRHIAARGWTMPDGTRTRIYLLRFNTAAVVDELVEDGFLPVSSPKYRLRGAEVSEFDEGLPARARVDGVRRYPYVETGAHGAEQVRQAYLTAGDTLALVVHSRKGGAEAVPFRQTVVLQSQLLG
ncbi:hypothetical protein WJ438_21800 [Streptomyces sp. GD-15H]|uniref:hypothetical protein n=1 Tax=Streptomyces sp. GD-15H TaxID=3129112 RepID=UPI00324D8A06